MRIAQTPLRPGILAFLKQFHSMATPVSVTHLLDEPTKRHDEAEKRSVPAFNSYPSDGFCCHRNSFAFVVTNAVESIVNPFTEATLFTPKETTVARVLYKLCRGGAESRKL